MNGIVLDEGRDSDVSYRFSSSGIYLRRSKGKGLDDII
jgi:hypothetical protein